MSGFFAAVEIPRSTVADVLSRDIAIFMIIYSIWRSFDTC